MNDLGKKHIIKTTNLSVGYHAGEKDEIRVLDNVNLTINAGELICLIGPNGCGKSTLIRTITGMQPPISGAITVNDSELEKLSRNELAKIISVVLTDYFSISNMTVFSLVSMGRYPHNGWFGRLSSSDLEIINNAIELTGLNELKNKNISELSDGIRQKSMIARALAQDTAMVFLDEPTAFIDLPGKIEIMHLLRKLAFKTSKAVLLSTHDLDLALQSADKIWLITPEKKIIIDSPEDLILNGEFERVFNKKDVKFNKQKGTFKIDSHFKRKLSVKGDKTAAFWTERALERIGIAIDTTQENKNFIKIDASNGKLTWDLNLDSQTNKFYSINNLVNYLKQL